MRAWGETSSGVSHVFTKSNPLNPKWQNLWAFCVQIYRKLLQRTRIFRNNLVKVWAGCLKSSNHWLNWSTLEIESRYSRLIKINYDKGLLIPWGKLLYSIFEHSYWPLVRHQFSMIRLRAIKLAEQGFPGQVLYYEWQTTHRLFTVHSYLKSQWFCCCQNQVVRAMSPAYFSEQLRITMAYTSH